MDHDHGDESRRSVVRYVCRRPWSDPIASWAAERLQTLGFDNYEEYLASSHWKSFKARYRASGLPQSCAVCGSGVVELHHWTYQRLGCEELADVVPLCSAHHSKVHKLVRLGARLEDAHHMIDGSMRVTILPPVKRGDQKPFSYQNRPRKKRTGSGMPSRKASTPAKVEKSDLMVHLDAALERIDASSERKARKTT